MAKKKIDMLAQIGQAAKSAEETAETAQAAAFITSENEPPAKEAAADPSPADELENLSKAQILEMLAKANAEKDQLQAQLQQDKRERRTERMSLIFRPSVVKLIKRVAAERHQSVNDYIETSMEHTAKAWLESTNKEI